MRLAMWSFLITFCSLALCGSLLFNYLQYALSASRSESMIKREQRLLQFLNTDISDAPARAFRERMQHFMEATPETDLIDIQDLSTGERFFSSSESTQWLRSNVQACMNPCLETITRKGHHFRVLTHTTVVHKRSIRLILAGAIDEHYDILRVVEEGFIGLIPFMMLGSMIGGVTLSRRALAPIGAMTEQARQLNLAGLHSRIQIPKTHDELQELALAWNDMLGRLESSTLRISQFAADASHDLRTAITIMLANAELPLLRDRSAETYKESLRTIASESTRMLEMLDGLLLTAGAGWSADKAYKVPVDILDLLVEVQEAHWAAARMRNHDLQLVAENSMRIGILADRSLMRRLLNILIENAIKYTPDGGVILVRLSKVERAAYLEVIDNGIGIPKDMQKQIFERLVRVAPERTDSSEQGYGLGLAIAGWIAELHGFLLEVESAPHQGSTFRIVFPEYEVQAPGSRKGIPLRDDHPTRQDQL